MQKNLEQNDTKYGKYILLDNGKKLYYDVLINEDSVDYDCLSIEPNVSNPVLEKYISQSGKRVDVIQCNTLDENSVIQNGTPSYQSIEMMISVNAKPNSEDGKLLIDKAREDYPLEYMKQYYYHLSLASCLFAMDKENYPFSIRASMVARTLREFYPKAELLSRASDYEHLDNMKEEIQPIKFGKITNGKSELNERKKETVLQHVSQILIERLKEKINGEFSSEFISKIEKLGAGKYLNDNLKNKLLDVTRREKEENISGRFRSHTASNAESLMQDIIEVVRNNTGIDNGENLFETPTVEISDIEKTISDRKMQDIRDLTEEIEQDENINGKEQANKQTREY